jgi:methyl coenzyme M reductase alpha subunit
MQYDVNTAIIHLQFTTSQAARFALGMGVDPEDIAAYLEDLAGAIRDPGSVAENMSPIRPDEF